MAIGRCRAIGIEGAPGSGKSTVALALTALLKQHSVLAACCEERARRNPFVEAFAVRGEPLTIDVEVQLFAETIAEHILASRHNRVLVCDRTAASVVAYARVLLGPDLMDRDLQLLDSMDQLVRAWSDVYDITLFLSDRFGDQVGTDPLRRRVLAQQEDIASSIRDQLRRCPTQVIDVPVGLGLEERTKWIGKVLFERFGDWEPGGN